MQKRFRNGTVVAVMGVLATVYLCSTVNGPANWHIIYNTL